MAFRKSIAVIAGFVVAIAIVLVVAKIFLIGRLRTIREDEVVSRTGGIGSIPGAILKDGTVCITQTEKSIRCRPLATIPREVVATFGKEPGFFDGIYDLDNSGAPEVFFDYWPSSDDPNCPKQDREGSDTRCDAIALLVYKKSDGTYREYAKLNAPTQGYSPGAWFLSESPLRKALFQTRCGGSSGDCLFYLDWKNRALDSIADGLFMIEEPQILDLYGDGHHEIFLTARGYDRTAEQGAALLRWKDDTYRVWWPTWDSPPYVIYARLVKVDGDDRRDIVAVLDTGEQGYKESTLRELGIWKLTDGSWSLADKTKIPDSQAIGSPELADIKPGAGGAEVALAYDGGTTVTCRYQDRKIACGQPLK